MRQAQGGAARITAQEAAALVKSGMWLDYGAGGSAPNLFDDALAARVGEVHDVKIRSGITTKPPATQELDPEGRSFHYFSWHMGGYDRMKSDLGRCHYLPCNLGEIPDYYRRFLAQVDVAVIRTAPMDEHGFFNFGRTNIWFRAVVEAARIVIVEESEDFPFVYGVDNGLHASEVDFVVPGNKEKMAELPNPPPTAVDRAVAQLIAAEVEDGACLQIGIGAMPNAVCSLLAESGLKDLGIHTEMMTDGILDLHQAGRVTGARKQIDQGKMTFSFCLGSRRLYEALHRNPAMNICPVDYTNAHAVIASNHKAVAINNTTQMDLQGQAASESDGNRHLTGTGGQLQFVRGAYASPGGKSIICLSSTYERQGQRKSRIVFNLTPGNIVTVPRSDMMYVATEYGIVNLKGKSVPERVMAMISLAHPDFREQLERQAHEHRLIPRGVTFPARSASSR
jgi:acyl-CoA hydrolase